VRKAIILGKEAFATLHGGRPPQVRDIAPFHPEIAEVADGSFRRKQPPKIVGSGYVLKSLEAALWAFHDSEDFREAVLRAVNLGDDADTTGAVCGQFAGAYWGEAGIPGELLEGVAERGMIEKALDGLLSNEVRSVAFPVATTSPALTPRHPLRRATGSSTACYRLVA
jgi:hypothetical protein